MEVVAQDPKSLIVTEANMQNWESEVEGTENWAKSKDKETEERIDSRKNLGMARGTEKQGKAKAQEHSHGGKGNHEPPVMMSEVNPTTRADLLLDPELEIDVLELELEAEVVIALDLSQSWSSEGISCKRRLEIQLCWPKLDYQV